MYRIFNKIALFLLIIVNFASIDTCFALHVVSSIKPFYNITTFITQSINIQHTLLIKNNASPHDFSLKPSDVTLLNQADLIIWSGENLETALIKLLQTEKYKPNILQLDKIANLKILPFRSEHTCSHNHQPHVHNHNNADPHFWLDPDNAKLIAMAIAQRLSKIDPINQAQYNLNLHNFNIKLDQLVLNLNNKLQPIQHKPFIVFHDGYQYFENYFNLHSVGFVTIDPHVPASVKKIIAVQKHITKHKAVCIFSEPQFKPKVIHTIVANSNIKTGELDPLGDDASLGINGYFLLLENLSDSILRCLT